MEGQRSEILCHDMETWPHFFFLEQIPIYASCSGASSVYIECSTTSHIHHDLCQKIKLKCWVSMSWHEISDPWPSMYWKHSESTLQLHFEGYKSTISSYGKEEKAFIFDSKVTLIAFKIKLKGWVRMFLVYGRPKIRDLMSWHGNPTPFLYLLA